MEDDQCNTVLRLGIGGGYSISKQGGHWKTKTPVQLHNLFPPVTKEEGLPTKEERPTDRSRSKSDDKGEGGTRKKLRLSEEQSALLEDRFRVHSILTPGQKQELAERLNLQPRQVEVWFQNRRARTKLKQTEVNCEFLKKCCESLSNENRRLKRELQELGGAMHQGGDGEHVPFLRADRRWTPGSTSLRSPGLEP